ncbi:MAG: peptidase C1, partial [Candidatus Neomarinimicrobiota bacterium]
MKKLLRVLLVSVLCVFLASSVFAQINKVKYVKKQKYPVLDELREEVKQEKALEDSITAEIRKRQKEQKDKEKEEKKVLRCDFEGVKKPSSPEDFKSAFHFSPVAQYNTGTCWCFCTTSYIESEVYRQTKQKIKLSELHTVYYEYLEKARRYLQERGDSEFNEGSECNAVFRIMKKYGAVPAEVYT